MFQNRCYDRDNDINNNFFADNMNNSIDIDVNNTIDNQQMTMQNPLVEPVQERCVHRTIMHEVSHVCPIRTRIINHHVYKHTYRPEYSCCEENVVSNVNQGSCCGF